MSNLVLRELRATDVETIVSAFDQARLNKQLDLFKSYLREQADGRRTILVAWFGDTSAGYVTIHWRSRYPPFQKENIPEIADLNVLPNHRRQGVGTALLNEAERRVAERSTMVGIGFGLGPDYGPAQRMYIRRGYVPDGRGLVHRSQRWVEPGEQVRVDDDLVLYLTKELS